MSAADPLKVECDTCRALPTVGCRVMPLYRGPYDAWADWTERKPHAARVRAAERAMVQKQDAEIERRRR